MSGFPEYIQDTKRSCFFESDTVLKIYRHQRELQIPKRITIFVLILTLLLAIRYFTIKILDIDLLHGFIITI